MRNVIMTIFLSVLLLGCNQTDKKTLAAVPSDVSSVFDCHGGIDNWKKAKALQFDLPKNGFTETHKINLISRKDCIEASDFKIGFDGKNVWLLDVDKKFQGNARFYHNLMFYFYSMPFVLADDGITFTKVSDLEFEGAKYSGYKVAYDAGIGNSPDDEYFIYFDSKTYQMQWLGYTVTYFEGKKNNDTHWIRYNDWQNIEGLQLPNSLTWYESENGLPTVPKNTVNFENVQLNKTAFEDSLFKKPTEGIVVEK